MVIKCKPIWTSAELYVWTLLFNVFSYGSKQSKDILKVHWTLTKHCIPTTKRNMYLQFSVENFWICQCLGTTGETILHLFSVHIHVLSLGQILCHHHSLLLEMFVWPWIKNCQSFSVAFIYSLCFCTVS